MTLSKSQRVLIYASHSPSGHVVYEQHGDPGEPDEGRLFAGIFILEQDWVDMDKPERITLTIEPGDRLNGN